MSPRTYSRLELANIDGQLVTILHVVTIGLLFLAPVALALAYGFRRSELFYAAGLGVAVIALAATGIYLRWRFISTLWRTGVVVTAVLDWESQESDDEGATFFQARYVFHVGDLAREYVPTRSYLGTLLHGHFPPEVTLLVDPERPNDLLRLR